MTTRISRSLLVAALLAAACTPAAPPATPTGPAATATSRISPTPSGVASPTAASATQTPGAPRATATASPPPATETSLPTPTPPTATHTVIAGETLFRIAARYGITVDALRAANGLTGDLIYAGQVLIIPTGVSTPAPTPPGPSATPPAAGQFRPVALIGVDASTLPGSLWTLARLSDGTDLVNLTGVTVTLDVGSNQISGDNGCNLYNAAYRAVTPSQFDLGPAGSTKRGCEPQRAGVERAFMSALERSTTWWVAGNLLDWRDRDGIVLATFSPRGVSAPVITSLNVSPASPALDSPLTIDWATTDVVSVTVQLRNHNAWWGETVADNQPATGRLVVSDTHDQQGPTTAILIAYGQGGTFVMQETTVTFPCRHPYFFAATRPLNCSTGPAQPIRLIEQRFEHGWMIWLQRAPTESAAIYLLLDTGQLMTAVDTYKDGDPVPAPETPPPGLYEPVRGFGQVWRGTGGVWKGRDHLGWAVEPEHPVDSLYQGETTRGDYKAFSVYFRIADGRIVHISGRTGYGPWEFMP
jgi:LysM repeat protein/heat shock protein HslJ